MKVTFFHLDEAQLITGSTLRMWAPAPFSFQATLSVTVATSRAFFTGGWYAVEKSLPPALRPVPRSELTHPGYVCVIWLSLTLTIAIMLSGHTKLVINSKSRPKFRNVAMSLFICIWPIGNMEYFIFYEPGKNCSCHMQEGQLTESHWLCKCVNTTSLSHRWGTCRSDNSFNCAFHEIEMLIGCFLTPWKTISTLLF